MATRVLFQSAFIAAIRLTVPFLEAVMGTDKFQSAFIAAIRLTPLSDWSRCCSSFVSIRFHRGDPSHKAQEPTPAPALTRFNLLSSRRSVSRSKLHETCYSLVSIRFHRGDPSHVGSPVKLSRQ